MSADLMNMGGFAQVISPASLLNLAPQAGRGKVKDAAQQFEALLIATLLRTARESSPGGLGQDEGEGSQSSTMLDLAGQQLSQMMARQGGFGLTRLIVQGLGSKNDSLPADSAAPLPVPSNKMLIQPANQPADQ